MALPAFTEIGDLPPGIHRTTLAECMARFGAGSVSRLLLAERLEKLYGLALATGDLARCVVFGSFVTDKRHPNDVDLFLLMEDRFDRDRLVGDTWLLFDPAAAQSRFGASVFWLRRLAAYGGEQETIEYWQTKRDGSVRGIVEIVAEDP